MYANRTQSTYKADTFSSPKNQKSMDTLFSLDFTRAAKGISYVSDNNIGNSILKNPQRGKL